jgi:phage gp29-like protein
MKFINPDLVSKMLPSIQQLQKYIKLAAQRDEKYRDTRYLMSFLQRLPQVDRYLLGLLQTRKIAVLGFNYTIKFPDDIVVTEQDKKRLSEMKVRFQKSKMYTLFNSIMNGILFGQSASRLTWENTKPYGTMVIKKQNYELSELDFSQEDSLNLDLIRTSLNGFPSRIPLDPETHVFVRYNPLDGIESDFPGSYIRTNMIYVLLKYFDYFNWASTNEKFADPLRYAQYKKGADPAEVAKILDGLAALGSDSYAAFSDDVKVEFLEAMRQGIVEMHEKFIESVNKEMSISLLGQTLTTDVQKIGSFAAAKVHNYVREDILWGDILEVQNIISTQYIVKDWMLNYGEPKDTFPVFEFLTDEIKDYESNSRIVTEFKAAGIPILKNEAYDKCGFTVPKEGEETI